MPKLIIIPTPIGNLEDITLRALETLKKCDIIFCEDTRVSIKLLKHYNINKPLYSYHVANEHKKIHNYIHLIESVELAGLISDAGTPGISDPGYLMIKNCLEAGIPIECLPGPTALIPALILSGLPCERFCFESFLPHKKGRLSRIKKLKDEDRTIILYESPHRLLKTLEQLSEIIDKNRKISISKEISKLHEETIRGSIDDVISYFKKNTPKGEFVIVIEGKKSDE